MAAAAPSSAASSASSDAPGPRGAALKGKAKSTAPTGGNSGEVTPFDGAAKPQDVECTVAEESDTGAESDGRGARGRSPTHLDGAPPQLSEQPPSEATGGHEQVTVIATTAADDGDDCGVGDGVSEGAPPVGDRVSEGAPAAPCGSPENTGEIAAKHLAEVAAAAASASATLSAAAVAAALDTEASPTGDNCVSATTRPDDLGQFSEPQHCSTDPLDSRPAPESSLHDFGTFQSKASDLPHLPPDFRIQLQMWQCMTQHSRLLHKLEQRQTDTNAQLASIYATITSAQNSCAPVSEAELERRLARHFDGLRSDLTTGHQKVLSHFDRAMDKWEQRSAARDQSPVRDFAARPARLAHAVAAEEQGKRESMPRSSTQESAGTMRDRVAATKALIAASLDAHDNSSCLKSVVQSTAFDVVCGLVITLNVIVICIQNQSEIDYALAHVGEGPPKESLQSVRLNYFFVAFYFLELFLKMAGLRCDFWRGEDWKWNMFDLVLVLFALYDVFADNFFNGSQMNQTWLRGFRLLKMFKMLRVVRVMRYFRELRNVITAIVGSLVTLIWSVLAITMMMFVFGLALLSGVSTYLNDTPSAGVPEVLLDDIKLHWGSVPLAILSLYMAISGGSDWEPLAAPLAEAGAMYYGLFLVYISLATIAVLNVVTGIFVDNAMSVVNRDAQLVIEEVHGKQEIEVLRRYLQQKDKMDSGMVDLRTLQHMVTHKNEALTDFLKLVQLEPSDSLEVFLLLSEDGQLDIEEFISGCMKFHADMKGIDTIAINAAVKRFMQQFAVMMEYVEDEFTTLRSREEPVVTLKDRLQHHRCLPAIWGRGTSMEAVGSGSFIVRMRENCP